MQLEKPKIEEPSFLKDLNEEQKKAVLTNSSKACIIAGAGCGKTKTLVCRLIYLLEVKKIDPKNILVLTFSKKAIQEIKKRIKAIFPEQKEINVFNFHAFCFQVLIRHYRLINSGESGFAVYDQNDQKK